MLAALVRFSVRFRGVVLVLAALLLVYGMYSLSRAGLDVFPEFSPRQVIIQTEAPGLSTEQVEVLVTQPVETALSGLIDLRQIRSESIQGLSVVTVIFEDDADVYRIRQLVSERLAGVIDLLPAGVSTPVPVPLASSSATVLTIGVQSASRDLMFLRDLVDATIVPRLLAVEGVADVNVFGGDIRQLQIRPRPEALQRLQVGLDEVLAAAGRATRLAGLGFIANDNQKIVIEAEQPIAPEALASVIVREQGRAVITLGDVARVGWAAAPPIGAAAIGGRPGIVMMVIGQYDANTMTVSSAVEAALADLRPLLAAQGVDLHARLFRPADYIEASIRNIGSHLLVGALFVVLVLFAFLFNLRTAFISALAIPLSLLGAVVVLLEIGVNLNIMVIGGLAIALGEVVDDAIIDTENIFRRLRENRALAAPRPLSSVVFDASMEVRGSVVYASFIVALVFVPLLTLSGVAGRLFAPLGFSYIVAILVSLLVALTVTPALCYALLAHGPASDTEAPVIRWLRGGYRRLLEASCRVPVLTVLASVLLCLLVAALLPLLGTRFLPELREGHYMVHTASAAGTSLTESIRIGSRLVNEFLQIPGVRSASQWAGRAERGADTFGSHYSEYEIDLEPMDGAGQQRVLDALRERLEGFPGIVFETETFLTERVNETISGYTSPVVINLYGNDLDRLDARAQEVAAIVSRIPGAADVQVRAAPATPMLRIVPDSAALARHGLAPAQLIDNVRIAFEGVRVAQVPVGSLLRDVVVILDATGRRQPEDLAALPVRTGLGVVRLDQLAAVYQGSGRYSILHQGAQRVQTVTAAVHGRDLGEFMQAVREAVLGGVRFEAGHYPEFTGAAVEGAAAREQLLLHAGLVGMAVLLLVYIAIGSLRHLLLVLLNLPFALVGGVLAALMTGAVVSVGSMVGFITLFGITVRNAIMLVSHYQHLVAVEGAQWSLATAMRGAEERLPSILMTALVTALAMLPIAVGSDNPGREIMGPMAAIIVGGLVSSTILNLAILPAVMFRFGRFQAGTGGGTTPA